VSDASDSFAKVVVTIVGLCWSVVVTVHAYGLTVQSWPWLIWGTIGTLVLFAAGGAWSKR
jgi:hypothetical protein